MVELHRDDRKELLSLLENLPEMSTERSRRQLLNKAGLNEIAGRLDVSGPPITAVSEIVDVLCKHGSESLVVLLQAVRELVGIEKRKFIDRLLVGDRAMVSS